MKQEEEREKASEASDWDSPNDAELDDSQSSKENNRGLSPFGIEHVDPLVFHQSNDSPELRASAIKIIQFPTLKVTEPAPVKPAKRKHIEWTPGFKGASTHQGRENLHIKTPYSKLRFLFGGLIVSIPIVLIILIVNFGVNLYK